MSDDWFTEFVFELVVDRQFVPADVMAVQDQEPVVLPAWDPMGTLAKLWEKPLCVTVVYEFDLVGFPFCWLTQESV